jgi:hypothetical protein
LLPALLTAACGRNHLLLQKAWAVGWAEGSNSPKLAQLKTPPFDQAAAFKFADELAKDPQRARALVAEWSQQFRQKYQAVIGATTSPAQASAP